MKTSDRVILIKGDANKWYDQVIFIVNKDLPLEKMPKDFVQEAENIIRNYLTKKHKQTGLTKAYAAYAPLQDAKPAAAARPAKKKRFDTLLNIIMLLSCVTIAAVFLFGLLG
jgi:hypothetical protein